MKRKESIWTKHLSGGMLFHEFPETSLYDFLTEQNTENLSRVAIEFEGQQTTYADFFAQIETAADALYSLGVRPGDVVSIASPNLPQALVTVYAASAVGAVCNMLHPTLAPEELQRRIEHTKSVAVFLFEPLYAGLADVEWSLPKPPQIVLYPASAALEPCAGTMNWQAFLALGQRAGKRPAYHGAPDDLAMILYSGGTTGLPKGVCLTNRNISCFAVLTAETLGAPYNLRSLAVAPIFHSLGIFFSVHAMFCCGAHLFLLSSYDANQCNRLIFEKKIECIFGVPALFDALAFSEEIEQNDLSFIRLLASGGDQLGLGTQERINRYLKEGGSQAVFISGYGLSECVGGCIGNPIFAPKPVTCGIIYPDMAAKIIDPETGAELPTGETGELCVSGPTVMQGYYNDSAATAKVLETDETGRVWLHTGDAFSVDEDGYYFFRYRLKRMIVTGGYNVYPAQVEEVVAQLPFVKQCCVVGAKAAVIGQRVVAFVSLDEERLPPDTEPRERILDYCRAHLESYAVPQEVRVEQALPLTKVGKLDYRALEALAEEDN